MIGLTADKLFLIAVLVGFLFGPERLPHLAERLGSAVRSFRGHLASTEHRFRNELGGDIDVNDWKKLDPRQYDPRTIIKDALASKPAATTSTVIAEEQAVTALDDPFADANLDLATSRTEPEIKPAFRRRSDGHLEPVPTTPAGDETEPQAAT